MPLEGQYPTYNGGRDRTRYIIEGTTDGAGLFTQTSDDYDGLVTGESIGALNEGIRISGLPLDAKFYKAIAFHTNGNDLNEDFSTDLTLGTVEFNWDTAAVPSGRIWVIVEVGLTKDS